MSHLSSHVIVWILQVNILSLLTPQSVTRGLSDDKEGSPGGRHDTPLAQGDRGVGQEARQPPRVLGEVARGAVVAVRDSAPIVWLETCNIGDGVITNGKHYVH